MHVHSPCRPRGYARRAHPAQGPRRTHELRDTVPLLEMPQCEQVQDEAPPDRHRAAAAADVCWAGAAATEPSY